MSTTSSLSRTIAPNQKPSKPEPKHNWGGHVFFDHETYGFYAECNQKAYKIAAQRKFGLIKDPFQRNLLLGEKSPRGRTHFDFDIPPAPSEKPRWVEPEVDYGLISLLPSQKKVFEKMHNMEKYYNDKLGAYKQHENEIKLLQEKEKESLQSNNKVNISRVSTEQNIEPFVPLTQENLKTFQQKKQKPSLEPLLSLEAPLKSVKQKKQQQLHQQQQSKKSITPSSPPPLHSHRISSLQSLRPTNPEVLDTWRTQRAAKYIEKYNNTHSSSNSTLPSNESKLKKEQSDNLSLLIGELEKTQVEIQKQEKKIKGR